MPSIAIKTIIDVEPAEMNGSGRPVGGTTPVTTAIFKSTWIIISEPIPAESIAPNLSGAFFAIFIMHTNKSTKIAITLSAPTKPVSSAIIAKMKSDSENGKNRYFCLEWKSPEPNIPPRDTPRSDWTNWKPSPLLEAKGSMNATSRFNLYGSMTTKKIA